MNASRPIHHVPASLLALLLLGGHALAAPFVVDGNVSDWGISVADNNASVLTPSIPLLYYAEEDQSDTAGDGGFLGPNHGGQNYDVEFLGIAVYDARVYFTLVSGLRPDNGFPRFGPGDIRMKINGISYGIEVGGGAGCSGSGCPASGAIDENAPGSTYTLDSHGFTIAHNAAAAPQTAGSIWSNPTWLLDPIAPQTPVQFQGGSYVGNADYIYTRNSGVAQQHSIIEASFDASLFGGISSIELEWGPSCGNDVLEIYGHVPEPGALSLLALGLAGFAVRRRRPGESAH